MPTCINRFVQCFLLLSFFIALVTCTNNTSDRSVSFGSSVDSLYPSGERGDTLYVPEGLKAEIWAESPQFYNPTNMDIDARGRIWVTEAVNYRDFNNEPKDGFKHFSQGDRVVILEDTNGDGRADSSKVFVQDKDLRAPLGIAVIGNKVIVSSSPSLIVYTDEDGDDKPDRKETFLNGFGGYDHDHGLHAVVAGPDGHWYFNAGNAGPHIVTDKSGFTLRAGSIYTGGTPYNKENTSGLVSDDGRIWVGGIALRANPDGTGLKVMGHNFRNNYEIALDSYGNMWQNDNDDQVQACRTSWLMEGGNAGYFSRDGSRFWRADRRPGQAIPMAHWHQEDPGVMPAGDITGAGAPTGIMVYESNALGPQYQGILLSADAGRNVIFGYMPSSDGAGYTLKRHKFISSVKESTAEYIWHEEVNEEKWFRPSDIAVGTDGALYIADWYDPVVGGHQMQHKKGYGRIYRISPESKSLNTPSLDLKTTEGQINALLNPAVNVRYSGFKRLKEQGETVTEEVQEILSSDDPYHRARAVWLLSNLGPKGVAKVEHLLEDPDDDIRITAFRSLRQTNAQKMLTYARQLAIDSSAAVRREVAIAMRDVPLADSQEIILELIGGYEGKDHWYLNALGIALDGKEEEFYPILKEEFDQNQGLKPEEWPEKLADLVWELHPKAAIQDLRKRAGAKQVSEPERKRAITALGFIHTPEAAEAMISLNESSIADVNRQASWWLQYRKTNAWQAYLEDWQAPPPEQPLAKHPEMLKFKNVVANQTVSLSRRTEMAKTMAKDSAGAAFLISLEIQNKLPEEVKEAVADIIFDNPDRYIRVLAGAYFDRGNEKKTYDINRVASLEGSFDKGKIQFYQNCIICHNNGEGGGEFGPSLANTGHKFDKKGLLDAIVNPEAAVSFGFQPWLITTKEGKVAYGILLTNGDVVVLRDIHGNQHIFNSEDIETKLQLSTSIMPDPNILEIREQELADLSSYLMNLKAKSR